jgi:hypothetical protein
VLEQTIKDFFRMIDVPLHIAFVVPALFAIVMHALAVQRNKPRLVSKGPWEGMPLRLDERPYPILIAMVLVAGGALWMAEYLGFIDHLPIAD